MQFSNGPVIDGRWPKLTQFHGSGLSNHLLVPLNSGAERHVAISLLCIT
jgi:hypothetical protein